MSFGPVSPCNHTTICDNPSRIDEESAATRELVATRVKGFNCHRRRFDTANKLGQQILTICRCDCGDEYDDTEKNGGVTAWLHVVRKSLDSLLSRKQGSCLEEVSTTRSTPAFGRG